MTMHGAAAEWQGAVAQQDLASHVAHPAIYSHMHVTSD